MKIKFFGATETVTGSKHMITSHSGKKYLLDCGLYQGIGSQTDSLNRHFGFNPSELEAVFLSHAHIDHSGNLPLLVKEGFNGHIYCTPGTLEVCEILLLDSAAIHEHDCIFINKRRNKMGLEPIKPLYTTKDAEHCLKHFKTIPYRTDFQISEEIKIHFTDAGHILGSAAIHVTEKLSDKITRLTYTGDIGRFTDLLMKAPEAFPASDYIISESTYGDRLHENNLDSELRLLNIIRKTCLEKKGKLIIPAFSLGRTQEIIFMLDKFKTNGLLPKIEVYVDSPLSTSATNIMRNNLDSFNDNVQEYLKSDGDPFGFEGLHYIRKIEESMRLNEDNTPCIIIAASGMMDAGRIKHHLRHQIGKSKNTVLIVGYCSPNTLGGQLLSGKKEVKIFGEFFKVNAEVEIINSYSAHADYAEMIRYLSCQKKEEVKTIFLVHGETNSKLSFMKRLNDQGYEKVILPQNGEEFTLE